MAYMLLPVVANKKLFMRAQTVVHNRMLMCASCMYVVTLSLIKSTKYACTIFFEAPVGPICSAYSICRLTYGKRLHSRLLNIANKMIHSMRRSKI